MLQKFIVAQTVFVAIVDEVLNEEVSARTRVSAWSLKEENTLDHLEYRFMVESPYLTT